MPRNESEINVKNENETKKETEAKTKAYTYKEKLAYAARLNIFLNECLQALPDTEDRQNEFIADLEINQTIDDKEEEEVPDFATIQRWAFELSLTGEFDKTPKEKFIAVLTVLGGIAAGIGPGGAAGNFGFMLLVKLGIATASATTPIGWIIAGVVACSLVFGAIAYFGLTRYRNRDTTVATTQKEKAGEQLKIQTGLSQNKLDSSLKEAFTKKFGDTLLLPPPQKEGKKESSLDSNDAKAIMDILKLLLVNSNEAKLQYKLLCSVLDKNEVTSFGLQPTEAITKDQASLAKVILTPPPVLILPPPITQNPAQVKGTMFSQPPTPVTTPKDEKRQSNGNENGSNPTKQHN